MQQLGLLDNLEYLTSFVDEYKLVGFNATLVEYDANGEEIGRCGFNWPEKMATVQEVKAWEDSLRNSNKINEWESIEPVPVYAEKQESENEK